jgi:Tfp pilus assembly protein PilX
MMGVNYSTADVGYASTGSNTYNITVQAIAPNAEVGKAVVNSIAEYERLAGTRR